MFLLPVAVRAQFTFTTNNGAITITGYTGSGGVVSIPNSVGGLPVTGIGDRAFYSVGSISKVLIPASITSIGIYAFSFSDNLTNVTLGSGVTNIDFFAVHYCLGLSSIIADTNNPIFSSFDGVLFNKNKTILIQCPEGKTGTHTIPDSVVGVEDYAFYRCASLTNVTLGSSLTNIAFSQCTSLKAIAVNTNNPFFSSAGGILFNHNQTVLVRCPEGMAGNLVISTTVNSFADSAFSGCTSLTSVALPTNFASIGDSTFANCTGLTNMTIPNSVRSIGSHAFDYCSGLKNVTLGSGVTNLGEFAFIYCYGLNNFLTDTNNLWFSSVAGVLFNKNQTVLVQCPPGKTGSYLIPTNVNQIGFAAFITCTYLTNMVIPSSVTNLGNNAFYGCASLPNITIPNRVGNIPDFAFDGCSSLASISLSESIHSLGTYAFYGCSSLTDLKIPGSVTNLAEYLFPYCNNLKRIFFTGNAPSVDGLYVFYNAPANLTVYYLPATTGWETTLAGRSTVLWNPQAQTHDASFGVRTNRFGFNLTGSSNLVIVVEACTNLFNPIWRPVQTNTLTTGAAYFSDSQWTNFPSRFYHLRSP